jgi:hypothetical protein
MTKINTSSPLRRLQHRPVETGGRLMKHAQMFGLLAAIDALPHAATVWSHGAKHRSAAIIRRKDEP